MITCGTARFIPFKSYRFRLKDTFKINESNFRPKRIISITNITRRVNELVNLAENGYNSNGHPAVNHGAGRHASYTPVRE